MKRFVSLSIILSVLLLACTTKTTPQIQTDASVAGGSVAVDAGECDSGDCDAGEGGSYSK